jgi:hypothetical protein
MVPAKLARTSRMTPALRQKGPSAASRARARIGVQQVRHRLALGRHVAVRSSIAHSRKKRSQLTCPSPHHFIAIDALDSSPKGMPVF